MLGFGFLRTLFRRTGVAVSTQAPIGKRVDGALLRKQSVEAVVIRACRKCGAPGEEGLTKCRNCGADRPPDEPQGVIWSREIRAGNIEERTTR